MSNVIDRRNKSMGGGSKRSTSQIKNIAVHYSATAQGNTSRFENHWKNSNGWVTGGYHEVVLTNGDVELNYDANIISNGVGGQNTRMYNICYVGTGKPNSKQMEALKERVNYNRDRFGISTSNVKGHREYSGQSTSCPGLDMSSFRKSLGGKSSSGTNPGKPSKPESKWTTISGKWTGQTLKSGHHGKPVEQLQKKIGVKADGYFGGDTESAVRSVQKKAGIAVDGMAGKDTYNALKGGKSSGMSIDGKWGVDVTKGLQRVFNTPVDGKLSGQSRNAVTNALYSNTATFGNGGSVVIKALQKKLGVTADGLLGPATIRALQKRMGTPVDGKLSKASPMVKELQKRLNKGKI